MGSAAPRRDGQTAVAAPRPRLLHFCERAARGWPIRRPHVKGSPRTTAARYGSLCHNCFIENAVTRFSGRENGSPFDRDRGRTAVAASGGARRSRINTLMFQSRHPCWPEPLSLAFVQLVEQYRAKVGPKRSDVPSGATELCRGRSTLRRRSGERSAHRTART
jgi:hypothetical protein